jgi:uncharacterized coiled-coil protein SlyX
MLELAMTMLATAGAAGAGGAGAGVVTADPATWLFQFGPVGVLGAVLLVLRKQDGAIAKSQRESDFEAMETLRAAEAARLADQLGIIQQISSANAEQAKAMAAASQSMAVVADRFERLLKDFEGVKADK